MKSGKEMREQLGWGQDGIVFSTAELTAVKGFKYAEQYQRELAAYRRLQERQVSRIAGLSIPQLIAFDHDLLVIEMEIVTPPFALDFASAWLDSPPPYPPEILEEALANSQELFEEHWPQVSSFLTSLRGIGIYLSDVNPRNITFE